MPVLFEPVDTLIKFIFFLVKGDGQMAELQAKYNVYPSSTLQKIKVHFSRYLHENSL